MRNSDLQLALRDAKIALENEQLNGFLSSTYLYLKRILGGLSTDEGVVVVSPNTYETTQYNEFLNSLKKSGIGNAFVALDQLKNTVANNPVLSEDTSEDAALMKVLKFTRQSLEILVSSYNFRNALNLLLNGTELLFAVEGAKQTVSGLQKRLSPPTEVPFGDDELSIFLPAASTYAQILQKLQSIESLYSETCRLLNVSEAQHPLQVISIEAGSLWIKVFGESRVINSITGMIESAASYIYRNFTREGKIRELPKSAELIKSLLKLSDDLAARGIDNSEYNENLQQAAVKITRDLNKLLRGQPSVTVNGREHSVDVELKDQFLLENRSLFLVGGDVLHDDESNE